ncbi:Ankyrin repeat [Desmophyllum pertusum]|uniref:Ankyrin repeat n=1 Tax=Desmophyllum pertusum TaxID=174260 RepID=A0A9W9ZZU3_9CNID|nr:Ankyrin repeat [Desmophyllum pertusum]
MLAIPSLSIGHQRQPIPDPQRKVAWLDTQINNCGKESHSVVSGRPRILLEAVSQGRLRQVRLLLDAGVNVNCKDLDNGQTALIRVMFLDNSKLRRRTAKMLMNYGAKVKVLDKFGRSALSWACLMGREDMVKLFFSNPEVDLALGSIDSEGNTNLMLASMSGNVNIVKTISKVFRRNRLDVNRVNNRGKSALTIAYGKQFTDCAEVLLNEGHVTPCVYETNLLRDAFSAAIGQRRNKPHTGLRQNSCNLPRLFGLYTEQLTNSYPRKCMSGGGVKYSAY